MSREKQNDGIAGITSLPCWQGAKRCWCEIECEDCIESHLLAAGWRKQEWISVEERLPQPKKLVLCIWERGDDRNNYGFARYQMNGVWYVSNEGMPRVTHWMPLLKPPKGE